MHLAGGDADLAAHAEFAAIGELGRGIVEENGGIDAIHEGRNRRGVFGDDRFGMMRRMGLDMLDSPVHAVDERDGNDGVEIFGDEILGACGICRRKDAANLVGATDLAALLGKRLEDRGEMGARCAPVDEERFGGTANAGAAHLGIERDRDRHVEIGRCVHIDVAETFEMGKDRHTRLVLNARDEALAAARHDDVEMAGEAFQHLADGRTIGGGHDLDRRFGQPRLFEPGPQGGMDRGRGPRRIRTTAQDDGIAGLQAQGAGIGGNIGPAFIDDADDAERGAHALDLEPVRTLPGGDDGADRISEFGDGANALGHGDDAGRVQRQPVDEGGAHAGFLGSRHIARVLGKDRVDRGEDRVGHLVKGEVLRVARRGREVPRGLASALAHFGHEMFDRSLAACCRYFVQHPSRP